jgi:hypothetical protein
MERRMERGLEEDLLKVVGARLRRDYTLTEAALPEPIARGLAKLQRAEQAAELQRHEKSPSEN